MKFSRPSLPNQRPSLPVLWLLVQLVAFQLTLPTANAVANDQCEQAQLLNINAASVAGTVEGATDDTWVPDCGKCLGTACNPGEVYQYGSENHGVWYKVVGNDHKFAVTTCMGDAALNKGFDSVITVWPGDCNNLGSCEGFNDNHMVPVGCNPSDPNNPCTCDSESRVEWDAAAGEEYYIHVTAASLSSKETDGFRIEVKDIGAADSPCMPNPCPSPQTCIDQGSTYTCHSQPDPCNPNPCPAGETCTTEGDTVVCNPPDPCVPNPCPAGQVCNNQGGTALCQPPPDPCDPDPCQDDEVCKDEGGGKHTCEPEEDPCDPNPCGWLKRTCIDNEDGTHSCKCFSGNNIVEVQGKGNVLMSSLQIGDYVRVQGGEYAPVYSFGHYNSKAKTDFLQIYTGKHPPLEVTAEHLLYVGDKLPRIVAAEKVKVGDHLLSQSGSSQQVTSIRKVKRHGYFAPHTTTGDIVVSGVVASNYAAVNWWAVHLSDPVLHWLQHGAAVPPRLFCKMIGGCTGEKYDASTGYSPYNTILFRMYQFQEGLPWILRAASISVLVAPTVVCTTLLGMLLSTPLVTFFPVHLAAALLGIFLVWKKDMVFKNKPLEELAKEGSRKPRLASS